MAIKYLLLRIMSGHVLVHVRWGKVLQHGDCDGCSRAKSGEVYILLVNIRSRGKRNGSALRDRG